MVEKEEKNQMDFCCKPAAACADHGMEMQHFLGS
jgi:hypothetical protein